MTQTKIAKKNQQKFLHIKEFNLPMSQYTITGSGALGVRNLREINDIDIIVTKELWNELAKQYGIIDTSKVKKIVFPKGIIEAMGEDSFYTQKKDTDAPTIMERINQAEIFDGLPFESLEHVYYYKQKMGRQKDLDDLLLIKVWWQAQNQTRY